MKKSRIPENPRWRSDHATYRQKKFIAHVLDKLDKYRPADAKELRKEFTSELTKGRASRLIDKFTPFLDAVKALEQIAFGEMRVLSPEEKRQLEEIYTRRKQKKSLPEKEDIRQIKKGGF